MDELLYNPETGKRELLIATHNAGKVAEFSALLAPLGIAAIAASALGLPDVAEDAHDFAGNARLKAVAAAQMAHRPALGDDSGLRVAALGGAPGLLSARWAERPNQKQDGKPVRDFAYAMARVESALRQKNINPEGAKATFVCALCLALPTSSLSASARDTFVFEGTVDGRLTFPPRGAQGFGYDPIFLPAGEARTFGEMPRLEKEAQSHRARAFAKLLAWLTAQQEQQAR